MAKVTTRGAPRRRGCPPLVSRAQVLDAAMALVDEQGLEALTMRRLGAALGVDPMTIYHHVPDKAALFDGLIERVYAHTAAGHRGGVRSRRGEHGDRPAGRLR